MNSIVIGINIVKRTLHDINAINFLLISPILAGLIAVVMLGGSGIVDVGIANISEEDYGLVQYIDNNEKYNVQVYNDNELEEKIENREIKAGLLFTDVNQLKLIALQSDTDILELKGTIEVYMTSDKLEEEKKQNQMSQDDKTNQGKIAIGMMTMFIIVFAGNSMAILLEDKKLKTFTRTFCAPIQSYEAVFGYLMSNVLLGIVQIIVFLFFTTILFNIEWGISVFYVFTLLLIYMIGAIGLAIGFAGFISDSKKYNMVLMLTGVLTSLIGGSFFPIENFNSFIKTISHFTPQKWMMNSFDILANGGSFIDIQMNMLILLLFGVVLFTFGVKTLRPNPDDL